MEYKVEGFPFNISIEVLSKEAKPEDVEVCSEMQVGMNELFPELEEIDLDYIKEKMEYFIR